MAGVCYGYGPVRGWMCALLFYHVVLTVFTLPMQLSHILRSALTFTPHLICATWKLSTFVRSEEKGGQAKKGSTVEPIGCP